MGAGTSVLAATDYGAKADALALWAPGLYGDPDADASKVTVPTLVMTGKRPALLSIASTSA